jgi:vacuolar-type H+-ATPase subunit H
MFTFDGAGLSEEREMPSFARPLAAAILTAGCYLFVPTVNVQAQSPLSGPITSTPEISDQKLSAVAAAAKRVAGLQEHYQQRIAEAPADKARIIAEAHNEYTKAVTDQGLSVEEYVSILDAARDDPEFRNKILQRMRPSDE